MEMVQIATIRSLNDQTVRLLAASRYDVAVATSQSALQGFLDFREARGMHRAGADQNRNDDDDYLGATSACLHPIPTTVMGLAEWSNVGIFRECFVWFEAPALARDTVSEDDTHVILTSLLFNLALCHHLRALSNKMEFDDYRIDHNNSSRGDDLQEAEKIYRSAISAGAVLINERMVIRPGIADSASWMLILAASNNLGCIAADALDYKTVQECIALGRMALQSIDLPLFWSNQFDWCNPSAAA